MYAAVHETGASRRKNDPSHLSGQGSKFQFGLSRHALCVASAALALACEPKLVGVNGARPRPSALKRPKVAPRDRPGARQVSAELSP